MTVLTKDPSDVRPDRGDDAGGRTRPGGRPERAWWRQPKWLGLLAVVSVLWVAAFVLPTYIQLDPEKSRVNIRDEVWFHYPVVIIHILTSMVALFAGCLQMSSQLRRQKPKVHRMSGRVYLFGGVFPGAIGAGALIAVNISGTPMDAGLSISTGNATWAILWFITGVKGLQYARRRRFVDHRRLMIYSFALTTAILWTRPFAVVAFSVPGFRIDWFIENVGWFPWVLNLIIAQLWLNKTAKRPVEVPVQVPVPAKV